jgi:quinol monooxygenase YgiN
VNELKRTSSNLSEEIVMPRFANVVTIEMAPEHRDQILASLAAHKARVKDELGTLQFEVLLPQGDDTKVFSFEVYRDAAAFEAHLNGPSLAKLREDIAGIVMKLHGVRCAVVD